MPKILGQHNVNEINFHFDLKLKRNSPARNQSQTDSYCLLLLSAEGAKVERRGGNRDIQT